MKPDGFNISANTFAALDDNGSGLLTSAELEGIRLWFDRNGDGRSQPSEVLSLSDLGIVSSATESQERDGTHPTAAQGLTFRDGHSVRTWDWIAEPASPPLAIASDGADSSAPRLTTAQ